MRDAATLAKRAGNFQEGARRIYDSQGDRADMWFLALYHFLTDVQNHLNGPAQQQLDPAAAILAGAQALADDVWHPPQPLRSLALYEQTKFKRQAKIVLEAALILTAGERE